MYRQSFSALMSLEREQRTASKVGLKGGIMDTIKELLKYFDYEEIGVQIHRSSRTIRRWEKHGRIPYSDLLLLKNILEAQKENVDTTV